ncbi:MAG: hypothetical protein JW986_02910 [Methanotrichaceae archaeon]|nr:hypothetical protein [Methanotrichaceae archaeon]
MRQILAALAAMLALLTVIPVMGVDANYLSPQANISTTPSIAAFLDDNWVPPSYVPPVDYAQGVMRGNGTNGTIPNATGYAGQFLSDDWTPGADLAFPTETAIWPGKDGKIATTDYAIYQFLRDDWTPGQAIAEPDNTPLYKLHEMS